MEETIVKVVTEGSSWISIGIPASVTIVGFVINYIITKKNILSQISSKKNNIQLEMLSPVLGEIFKLYNDMVKGSDTKKTIEGIENLHTKIFAYGSSDAIKILSTMQSEAYIEDEFKEAIYYFVLLICQVKYDLTEIKINPNEFYKLKITDYDKKKLQFKSENNKIVQKLGLNNFLLIK